MSAIRPNKAQFVELMEAPDEGPVVMLNLLKFKERADSAEPTPPRARASTTSTATPRSQMVEARGGKVLWMGQRRPDPDRRPRRRGWDSVALVQYPSRKAFIEMVSTPGVRAGARAPRVGVGAHGADRVHERVNRLAGGSS